MKREAGADAGMGVGVGVGVGDNGGGGGADANAGVEAGGGDTLVRPNSSVSNICFSSISYPLPCAYPSLVSELAVAVDGRGGTNMLPRFPIVDFLVDSSLPLDPPNKLPNFLTSVAPADTNAGALPSSSPAPAPAPAEAPAAAATIASSFSANTVRPGPADRGGSYSL